MAFWHLKLLTIAQMDAETTDSVVGSQVWNGGGYAGVMLLLILLLAFMIALFVFFKRAGLPKIRKTGELELLETRPLGGRQFIVVGKYREERFLLGVCPGSIKYLCQLSDDRVDAASLMNEFSEEDSDEA